VGLYRQIKTEVTRLLTEARTRPVLILDEAHGLGSDVLEEMRLLTNYAMDAHNRLCLLFCGQSELRRRLAMAVHEALNQRVVVRFHLPPLGRDELGPYLVHLLRRVGTELPLFEPAAVEAIFQLTQGLPRKINLLAHHPHRRRPAEGQGRYRRSRPGRDLGAIVMAHPELGPHHLLLAPQLGPLAILDVALAASGAALLAEHPRARQFSAASLEPQPPIVTIAALLLERSAELRQLLARYRRRALHELRAQQDSQAPLPF
jgi:hypothetical protein